MKKGSHQTVLLTSSEVTLSEQIPNSQLVTIPNAGHALMYWDKTIESISSFCNQD